MKMSKQTILNWANPKDDEGNIIESESWSFRRDQINREVSKALDTDLISQKAKMLTDIDKVYDKAMDQILEFQDLEFSNLERAMSAFSKLFEQRMKVLGLGTSAKTTNITLNDNRQIALLFDVIEKDEVIGDLFKARKSQIIETIEAKLIEEK